MKIEFKVIEHNEQRYETCGDWWLDDDGVIQFRASKLSDDRYSALVFIHEVVELLTELAKRAGGNMNDLAALRKLVSETDAFDKAYEKSRPADDDESEPGCESDCPVYQGHMVASSVENTVAMILGVNYNDYAAEIAALAQNAD